MRTGLSTRVDRIAAQIAKRATHSATIICTLFDTDDETDIVGVMYGHHHVARLPGEAVSQLLDRARELTGVVMWVAEYRESVGGCIDGYTA